MFMFFRKYESMAQQQDSPYAKSAIGLGLQLGLPTADERSDVNHHHIASWISCMG